MPTIDPFGNYVVQRILEVAPESERVWIGAVVQSQAEQLRELCFCKHVLEKTTPEKLARNAEKAASDSFELGSPAQAATDMKAPASGKSVDFQNRMAVVVAVVAAVVALVMNAKSKSVCVWGEGSKKCGQGFGRVREGGSGSSD
eukprot:COSAG05_NODE_7421_length_812_cov_0.795518_2_plen_144_part_00